MRVCFASSEVVPFVKTGGLGDVSGALPIALSGLDVEVCVVMPLYSVIDTEKFNIEATGKSIDIRVADSYVSGEIFTGKISDSIQVYFVKNNNYFDRAFLYGEKAFDYPDNAERFAFFSRAVLETLREVDFKPDLIHLNDWQTGLVPLYLKTIYKDDVFFNGTATLFTIHNIGYQGIFPIEDFRYTCLSDDILTPEGLEYYGKVSFLKGGLISSEMLTTVSPTYCREIQDPEYGMGLEGVVQARSDDIRGILNGADYKEWDPSSDKIIIKNYSSRSLGGKWACKKDLLGMFGFKAEKKVPVIGVVSRLSDQKGMDIFLKALMELFDKNFQFILLGRGEEKYQKRFQELENMHPEKIGVKIGFDNELAHKIQAGADIFVMPSKYEPCGLSQIYSLKYGTVPVVRGVGGLNDTVDEVDETGSSGTGVKFSEYSSDALKNAICRALALYDEKAVWKKLIIRGMEMDFSWEKSAKEYLCAYKKAVNKRYGFV